MQVKTLLTLLIFSLSVSDITIAEELIELKTPRGVDQKFLLLKPDKEPVATIILFAGGHGALKLNKGVFGTSIGWGKNNFLVRSRKAFAKKGFIVATVDAPSDKQGKTGMYGGYRTSGDHVTDIDSVIAKLREIADIPIWLIGTSRGTESAAYVGIHSAQKPAGVVLTSSMTENNRKGTPVPGLPLDRLQLPVLITHHENDGCKWTTPAGAQRIRDALTSAPAAELRLFKGGRQTSKPCQAMSYHGYLGIEDQVVDAIAAFIETNS